MTGPKTWRRKPRPVQALAVPQAAAHADVEAAREFEAWLAGLGVTWQRVPLGMGISYRIFSRFGGSTLAHPGDVVAWDLDSRSIQTWTVSHFESQYEPE